MSDARREIAGVTVPDTPLVARSMEEARTLSEPYLFNRAVRSWLFAVQLSTGWRKKGEQSWNRKP